MDLMDSAMDSERGKNQMNTDNKEMNSFYQAMCKSIDGYVFICEQSTAESGYKVTLSEEFIQEFQLPEGSGIS